MNKNKCVYLHAKLKLYLFYMKRLFTLTIAVLLTFTLHAQSFESATEAVKNMGVGWNLGNTLEAFNSNGSRQGLESEIYWGAPYTEPKLMHMMKDAGFGAIRVPVTWMNHMDANGKVDEDWMNRVRTVVDYVLDAGMYCILNVHHDTGSGNVHWLHANMSTYNSCRSKYEFLWQQIATTFKDYDQRLLFESYNEMLDKYNSWCFATFNSSSKYIAADAADAYEAINNYAQSFVTTVRGTGGNNAKRNLVVNTYGACNGSGTWNSHLQDPLKEMKMPSDPAGAGHIAFQVHTYPDISNLNNAKNEVTQMFSLLNNHLVSKGGPVIVGEWGTSNVDAAISDYDADRAKYLDFVTFFVKKAKEGGFGLFYWMGISNGSDRSIPVFSQADLAQTMIEAYHGSTDGFVYPSRDDLGPSVYEVSYNSQWGELNLIGSAIKTADYSRLELELAEKPATGLLQFKVYPAEKNYAINASSNTLNFNTSTMGATINRVTMQSSSATAKVTVKSVTLVKTDGTKYTQVVSPFWGCSVKESFTTGINTVRTNTPVSNVFYNLQGQQVTPRKGIYIHNGRKVIIK